MLHIWYTKIYKNPQICDLCIERDLRPAIDKLDFESTALLNNPEDSLYYEKVHKPCEGEVEFPPFWENQAPPTNESRKNL